MLKTEDLTGMLSMELTTALPTVSPVLSLDLPSVTLRVTSTVTYSVLHHQLVFLPHCSKGAPAGMARGYGVSSDPSPTGVLVEVSAGVDTAIHGGQQGAGDGHTLRCQAHTCVEVTQVKVMITKRQQEQ